ncbi:MAG TPA: S4 domain-containing protein, partial [Acidobacteriota bacterium]|nr:S4 domain-containing protein [Acidobacteriota bacterium]
MPGPSPERAAPPQTPKIHLVPASRAGERLDRFLAEVERSLSRSAVQTLIDQGHVRLNDAP